MDQVKQLEETCIASIKNVNNIAQLLGLLGDSAALKVCCFCVHSFAALEQKCGNCFTEL